ncbi:hypothetical protein ACL2XO_19820 [Sodalis sp. RH15]|uniref:hypothetical protein n=1 Tax=Sodalis sp. RH15 TaxID=3394330 RepID=UPI0039B61209
MYRPGLAKADANWIDLYYSPYRNVSRKNIKNFDQNPLGRFTLEDTEKLYSARGNHAVPPRGEGRLCFACTAAGH